MNKQNNDVDRTDLRELLARGGGTGLRLPARGWLIAAGLLILAVLAYALFSGDGTSQLPQYRTEQAVMGNLVVKVSATGNLKPTNQVDVALPPSASASAKTRLAVRSVVDQMASGSCSTQPSAG